jgi:hypothetical protein
VKYRAVMRDWSGYWGRTFSLGLHSIDFTRAILGSWWLAEAITRAPDARGFMAYGAIIVTAAALALATVLQTAVCKEPDTAHAPFAFVAGLAIGFLPPMVSGFALVIAISLARGANAPGSFFPVLAVAVAAISSLFFGRKLMFPVASFATAAALPWLITLLFPCHFVCTMRARPKVNLPPPPR